MKGLECKKIKVGKGYIDAILFKLPEKNLIVLRGAKGYIMCGYLNLSAAEKFKDAAAKAIGVSSIKQLLEADVFSCSRAAAKLGIYKGQPVKEALKIIV